MNNKSISELLDKIEVFSDNEVIINQLKALDDELVGDLDYPSEKVYWLREAASQMEGMFSLLMDIKKSQMVNETTEKATVKKGIDVSSNINVLELKARTLNVLSTIGIVTISDLLSFTEIELLKTPDLGRNMAIEIKEVLYEYGLLLNSSR